MKNPYIVCDEMKIYTDDNRLVIRLKIVGEGWIEVFRRHYPLADEVVVDEYIHLGTMKESNERSLLERAEAVKAMKGIQCQPGNFDQSPYMLGLANGLTLATNVLFDRTESLFDPRNNAI